jgi:rare lipoprotein A
VGAYISSIQHSACKMKISRTNLNLAVLIFTGLVLSSCGIVRTGTVTTGPIYDEDLEAGEMLQAGIASWYGPKFHGRTTANGETYNMEDFTAAHKTLPFNTIVRVTNQSNNRSVDVRINDRGPYVGDRVIDLSRRAADEINMIGPGTADVTIHLLQTGDRPITNSNRSSRETFTVQLASFDTEVSARERANQIPGADVVKVNIAGREVYRVYYGSYEDRNEADQKMRDLRRQGINGFVKQKEN